MKKLIHKNQLVITTLAVLIAVAGYISFDRTTANTDEVMKEEKTDYIEEDYVIDNATYDIFDEMEDVTDLMETAESDPIAEEQMVTDEEIINPGETVLTSLSLTNSNYAAEVKLNREQVRSKNKEVLSQIIENDSLTDEQKQAAVDQMVEMTDIAQREVDAEMLLEAKGFSNAVVSISANSCDVVVDMGDVTDAKRAQVEDIVKRKTGIAAENIIITTIDTNE